MLPRTCPDCGESSLDRRAFLQLARTTAGAVALGSPLLAEEKKAEKKTPESLVKVLHESLNDEQKKEVCFDWDHKDKTRGLLRKYISNNWRITKPAIKSKFFTADQQKLIRDIFEGL